MRFLSTFGQLQYTKLSLFLIVISGFIESFGLSLFIPLLHMMGENNVAEMPRPFPELAAGLEPLGVTLTPTELLPVIIVLSLLAIAFTYIQRKIQIKAKENYAFNLRNTFIESLLNATWNHSSQKSHGDIVNQMTLECSRAGNALGAELLAVAAIVQIVLLAGFSVLISWQLMVIATVFGFLVYFAVRPFTKQGKILGQLASKANRDLSFYNLEYVRNLKVIKAMAGGGAAKASTRGINENYRSVAINSELNSTKVYVIVQALPVVLLGALIYVSYNIMELQVSVILVFLLFMMRIAPRIGQLQQHIQTYYQRSHAVRVVTDAIDECHTAVEEVNSGAKIFEHIENSIELDAIEFGYPDSAGAAVNNVSMTIHRNQLVAIVGSSGAGKSTIIDLLAGLRVPDKGEIKIDGIRLGQLDLISWRRKLGIVTQDATVFNTSLRNNLTFFNPEATTDDLQSALSLTHLEDVVNELPLGLETELGENGVRISGGQKQRLVLARALVRKPELLLLDEATSALDNETERFIQNTITELVHTMTIVVVAHRLSTIRRADIIFVMEEGKVVESGTYKDLMERGGRFTDLRNLELY